MTHTWDCRRHLCKNPTPIFPLILPHLAYSFRPPSHLTLTTLEFGFTKRRAAVDVSLEVCAVGLEGERNHGLRNNLRHTMSRPERAIRSDEIASLPTRKSVVAAARWPALMLCSCKLETTSG
ncbi:hypothetical protein L249_3339 [Ophiocordyceps polyrhachis-furcata BCC 54312]|uniref:Uncharacterized protein n=1 Tax=Ophiocordyceps polyrhachis-furcata BCC 54312 TaxID=1330021 RepID=A0A367LQ87_9HYPO|nr:hypothetical protein L249_3339 [Ophiocordyceps polyrhachis-furcata BCC 54312]